MNLIHRASFTWLEPATPAERRTLARLDEIDGILRNVENAAAGTDEQPTAQEDTPAAALTKERAKLAKGLQPAGQWRITVKTGSVLDMARRASYMEEARDWYNANVPDPDEQEGDLPMAEMIHRNQIWHNLRIWSWARAMTEQIEERTVDRLALDSDAGWAEMKRPPWLEQAGAWLETIPNNLADAWLGAIVEVNPGLIDSGEPDETKKKFGGASATK